LGFGIICAVLAWRSNLHVALICAVFVMTTAIAIGLIAPSLSGTTRLSLRSADRVVELRAAATELGQHPWWGTSPREGVSWTYDGIVRRTRYVHNELLQVSVDLGVPAGLLFVFALVGTIVGVIRSNPTTSTVTIAIISAALLPSLFDFTIHIPVIPLWTIAFAAAAAELDNTIASRESDATTKINIAGQC
jgi:O-antigen ligase